MTTNHKTLEAGERERERERERENPLFHYAIYLLKVIQKNWSKLGLKLASGNKLVLIYPKKE